MAQRRQRTPLRTAPATLRPYTTRMHVAFVAPFTRYTNNIWFQGVKEAAEELHIEADYLNWCGKYEENHLPPVRDYDAVILMEWWALSDRPFCERMRACTKNIGLWYPDHKILPRPKEMPRNLLKAIFLTNSQRIEHYRQYLSVHRAHFIPQGCLDRAWVPEPEIRHGILFAGERHGNEQLVGEIPSHRHTRFEIALDLRAQLLSQRLCA